MKVTHYSTETKSKLVVVYKKIHLFELASGDFDVYSWLDILLT